MPPLVYCLVFAFTIVHVNETNEIKTPLDDTLKIHAMFFVLQHKKQAENRSMSSLHICQARKFR